MKVYEFDGLQYSAELDSDAVLDLACPKMIGYISPVYITSVAPIKCVNGIEWISLTKAGCGDFESFKELASEGYWFAKLQDGETVLIESVDAKLLVKKWDDQIV